MQRTSVEFLLFSTFYSFFSHFVRCSFTKRIDRFVTFTFIFGFLLFLSTILISDTIFESQWMLNMEIIVIDDIAMMLTEREKSTESEKLKKKKIEWKRLNVVFVNAKVPMRSHFVALSKSINSNNWIRTPNIHL